MRFFAVTHDPAVAVAVCGAGPGGVMVDWERRGKAARQRGVDTQVAPGTLADLRAVRAAVPDAPVVVRLDGVGPGTPGQVARALAGGADEVLVPMVRTAAEVDRVVALVAGRAGVAVMVETVDALRVLPELVRRPLSRAYVGLHDLMIDRHAHRVGPFGPLVDGTLDEVAATVHAAGLPFGVAGLTVVGGGEPVPSRLLAAELVRLGADFTFLRRSFLRDTVPGQRPAAVAAMHAEVASLAQRGSVQVADDRRALRETVLEAAAGTVVAVPA